MNPSEIHHTYKSIVRLLSAGRLKDAIVHEKKLADDLQIGYLSDQLADLQQNYQFMLQYFAQGIDDPARKTVYNKLIARLFSLNAIFREELMSRDSSNFEYARKRYFPHTKQFYTTVHLFGWLKKYHEEIDFTEGEGDAQVIERRKRRVEYEKVLTEFFTVFWLTTYFSTEEKQIFNEVLEENEGEKLEKPLLVSALTLNLWRMFDESKLMMLFDACLSHDMPVRIRAMVGVCFVLAKYNRFLPYFPSVRNRLVLMADDLHTQENFRNIIVQIIGTSETDKIAKKMREEILPEMMKISPMLKEKMDESIINPDDWDEENPQWQEMFDDAGVTDILQELTDLQMEGADVYMGTFAMLKNFPFFSEFSHWFLPFDSKFSSVSALFDTKDSNLINAFMNASTMCNSDKYSFCLSVLQMPESQRNMMKYSFKAESEQLEEMTKDEAMLTPDVAAKNISKQYIQDLFRFFKLYPLRADFSDMFASSLFMHKSYLFDILAQNSDLKTSVAEYYFSKSLYEQALDLYELIAKEKEPTAALYQKIGFAHQKMRKFPEALDAYMKADVMQPDDDWTIQKIAMCCRLQGNYEKALEFYRHAEFLNPGKYNTNLQIGHCYLALKKYKEALDVYFKLDALDADNIKIERAIAWTSFVSGNLSQADYFSQKIMESGNATAFDYLNAGHITWGREDIAGALEKYKKSYAMFENKALFADSIENDKEHLRANGVSPDEIPLMLDAII
jgi:tetratricopeptide (TPR) repeat protein